MENKYFESDAENKTEATNEPIKEEVVQPESTAEPKENKEQPSGPDTERLSPEPNSEPYKPNEFQTYSYTRATNPDISRNNATGGVRSTYIPPNAGQNQAYRQEQTQNTQAGNTFNGYNQARPNNTFNPNARTQFTPPPQPPKKPKAKIGAGAIAAILAVCIVVSSACGFAGAYLGNKASKSNTNNELNYVQSSTTVTESADGSIAAAAEIAVNSVVEITTEIVQKNPFYGQYVQSGAGSGVIIDSDNGYIITCAHVIDGASSIKIRLRNGNEYDAKEIGADSQTDIAVVQITPKDEQLTAAITGDSDKLQVGQTAIAIGNPLGTLGGTVSSGIISALNRDITIDGQNYSLLQIDTSINPGNSGGGLFDIAGNLIAVVNAKSSGSESSTTIEGLGFAIPINKAIEVSKQLISNGYVGGRASLGILIMEITQNTTSSDLYQSKYPELSKYVTDYGVYFVDYQSGQSGDFQFGDRIIAINGISVSSKSDISSLLQELNVGDEVEVTVSRLGSDKKRSQMETFKTKLKESLPQSTDETTEK